MSTANGRPRPPMSAEEVAQAVAAYGGAQSIRQIAAQLDRPYTTVRFALLAAGVTLRPSGGVTQLPRDQVAAAYRAGQTIRQIAAQFHYSTGTVWHALNRAGVQMRPVGRRPDGP